METIFICSLWTLIVYTSSFYLCLLRGARCASSAPRVDDEQISLFDATSLERLLSVVRDDEKGWVACALNVELVHVVELLQCRSIDVGSAAGPKEVLHVGDLPRIADLEYRFSSFLQWRRTRNALCPRFCLRVRKSLNRFLLLF